MGTSMNTKTVKVLWTILVHSLLQVCGLLYKYVLIIISNLSMLTLILQLPECVWIGEGGGGVVYANSDTCIIPLLSWTVNW